MGVTQKKIQPVQSLARLANLKKIIFSVFWPISGQCDHADFQVLALVKNLPMVGRIGQQPSGMVGHFSLPWYFLFNEIRIERTWLFIYNVTKRAIRI